MEGDKKTKGRQKIEMKKIENYSERQVTFSKRKSGIIKKASEMSILTGADVAFLIFSEAGKPYSFGSPSIESVARRFFPQLNIQNQTSDEARAALEANRQARVHGMLGIYEDLEIKLKEAQSRVKELKTKEKARTSRDQGGPGWWEKPVEGLNVVELQHMYSSIERLRNDINSYRKTTASAGGSSSGGATATFPADELLQNDFSSYLTSNASGGGSSSGGPTGIASSACFSLESAGGSSSGGATGIPHTDLPSCFGLEYSAGSFSGGTTSIPPAAFPAHFGLESAGGSSSGVATGIPPAAFPAHFGLEYAGGSTCRSTTDIPPGAFPARFGLGSGGN